MARVFAAWAAARWSWLGAASILGLLSYPSPLAWAALVGLLTFAGVRARVRGWPVPSTPFNPPIVLYLAGALVGLYITVGHEMAAIRFFGLLAAVVTFWMIVDRVSEPVAAQRIALGLMVGVALCVPLMLVLGAPYLRADRLPGAMGDVIEFIARLAAPLDALGLPDAFSGQRFRLHASGPGALAAGGIGLALGPLLEGDSRRERLAAGLAALICGLGLLLAGNRGSMFSAALVVMLLGALRFRWLLLIAVLLILSATAALVGLIPGQLNQLHELPFLPEMATDLGPFRVRQEYWENALYLLGDYRFSGVGLGMRSVRLVYDSYFMPVEIGFSHAHNIYLQSYLEQGLLGLAGLIGLSSVALVVGWAALADRRRLIGRQVALSGAGLVLMLAFSGLTDIVAVTSWGMVLLFAGLGLLHAGWRLGRPPRSVAAGRPSRTGGLVRRASLALALVAGLAVASTWLTGSNPSASLAGRLSELPRDLGYGASVNLGALDLAKASLDDDPPDRREVEWRVARAHFFLRQAQQLNRSDPSSYRVRAAVYLVHKEPTEARFLLEQATPLIQPDDSRSFFQLGRLYRDVGDIDRVVEAWSHVDLSVGAWTCAGPAEQLTQWGAALAEHGVWNRALEVDHAALLAAPTEEAPYRQLGDAYRQLRRNQSAVTVMNDLIRDYPTVPWPYDELARTYAQLKRPQEAEAWQRRAAEVLASPGWAATRDQNRKVRDCKRETDLAAED